MEKEVYAAINTAWKLAKKYRFGGLTDDEWTAIVEEAGANIDPLSKAPIDVFRTELNLAVLNLYEHIRKEQQCAK